MELSEIQQAIEALPAHSRKALLVWMKQRERQPSRIRGKQPGTLTKAVFWTLVSIAAFLLVDAAIFRSGWYLSYLQPDSSAGQIELHLFWLRHSKPGKIPEVAVVGDSRIAEGFGARLAGQAVGDGIHFWNVGIPGSTPRDWYYLLRDADPGRKRFAAIAIAMDRYSDEDFGEDPGNRITDLSYVIGRLRLSDCVDFARSHSLPELRRSVLTGCLFKAVTLRRDVQDLLSNSSLRLKTAREWRNLGHGYIDGYGGKPEALTGLTADFATRTINFPPGLKDWQRDTVRSALLPDPAPQTGALTAYRKLWLGRILDLYKDSPTHIVFLELPSGPLPHPEPKTPALFITWAAQRPRVKVLPRDTFRDLEHPEVYADGLHLNVAGRPVFSARLAEKIAEVLGR